MGQAVGTTASTTAPGPFSGLPSSGLGLAAGRKQANPKKGWTPGGTLSSTEASRADATHQETPRLGHLEISFGIRSNKRGKQDP